LAFFTVPTPFFFVEAPPRGFVFVVAVVLFVGTEAAAVVPRVDLVCRLVAMELVFSDMRERNDKHRSRAKGKISGPMRKQMPGVSGPRNLGN